jgi:uncharacterized membrane protein
MPIVTQVLLPTSIGIAVGLVMSLISVKLSYDSSIRLIEIQSTFNKIKTESENLGDDSPIMILKRRLATGKITKSEYEDLKSSLE